MPGKAINVWAHKGYSTVWVQIEDDSGATQMWSGCEFVNRYETGVIQSMAIGHLDECDENEIRQPFRQMKFPEQVTIVKVDGYGYRNSFAIDTRGTMWVWGYKFAYDDYYGENNDAAEMCTEFKDRYSPCKIDWFEKNGYRVLDIAVSETYVILKASDKQGSLSVMGMIHPDYWYNADEYFGNNKTKLVDKTLWTLDSVNPSLLQSFDCGDYMTMFCNKPPEKNVSIIPGRETPSGFTHFYKDGT